MYNPQPYSSRIVLYPADIAFYWDVTDFVVDWVLGTIPNYGISIRANITRVIYTANHFHNVDPVKKLPLLVFYAD